MGLRQWVGRMWGNTAADVVITEFPITTTPGSAPIGITRGPGGNLWFTEYLGNKIGRITTAGVITEFAITTTPNSGPIEITRGPDGNLWFTENLGNKIAKFNICQEESNHEGECQDRQD